MHPRCIILKNFIDNTTLHSERTANLSTNDTKTQAIDNKQQPSIKCHLLQLLLLSPNKRHFTRSLCVLKKYTFSKLTTNAQKHAASNCSPKTQ